MKQTYATLVSDLDEALAYGRQNPSEFAHRTLVRTHFAFVEGLTFQLRQVALAGAEEAPGLFATEEVVLLREEQHSLSDTGKPESRTAFQQLLPSIRFVIKCFARTYGADFTPNYNSPGWQAMHDLRSIRNRLMHPKGAADLHLTDDDLKQVVAAAGWFRDAMESLFDACTEADAAYRNREGA